MMTEMLIQLTDQLGDTYKKLNEAEIEIVTLKARIKELEEELDSIYLEKAGESR